MSSRTQKCNADALKHATCDNVDTLFKKEAKKCHPDKRGSTEKMQKLNNERAKIKKKCEKMRQKMKRQKEARAERDKRRARQKAAAEDEEERQRRRRKAATDIPPRPTLKRQSNHALQPFRRNKNNCYKVTVRTWKYVK